MSFGLEALFDERLEPFPLDSSTAPILAAKSAEATIKSLIHERDALQAQVNEDAATIDKLQRRIYSKTNESTSIPYETVSRLQRLENETHRLRKENSRLAENLTAAESEACVLREKLSDQAVSLKGANKKTKNAKDVAGKAEGKAKNAVSEKQRHADLEKKMRRERNEALAKVAEVEKKVVDLEGELGIERQGKTHLRELFGTAYEEVMVVVPFQMVIKRGDYGKVKERLERARNEVVQMIQSWYNVYKKGGGQVQNGDDETVVGVEDGVDEDMDKLYGDMVEGDDIMTGADHDNWHS